MKKLVIGILAHVDAGKTTLSEAMLYKSGGIRKLGRVDNQDAFLDTYSQERARGITIFSKQAEFCLKDIPVTLLDTPGHVDFSAEMERTLKVLDYGILVISGADGVQGHTRTLWSLFEKYQIPVFVFINKMDQRGTDQEAVLRELGEKLSWGCVDFSQEGSQEFYENAAMCDEIMLEKFLEHGSLDTEDIKSLIARRRLFPCYFGSALKLQGVKELMDGIGQYSLLPQYPEEFGARVFKIARDDQGSRLTYLKVTGGVLKVKAALEEYGEKVNQIRVYSGEKYTLLNEAEAGCICAVTGLTKSHPGDGLGAEAHALPPILEPVLTYQIQLPEGCDPALMLPKLRELEEEEPELHIVWNEALKEIYVRIMGQVQLEILKSLIEERFGIQVSFGEGNIVYKETIKNRVEGVGHYEPLRHYAEVHLILEPGAPGSGLHFYSECSEDILDKNWQRLVLTHLEEKEHKGVLTGAAITDMNLILVSGRAHQKHTEGGDFRQATYRAVRQGLRQAESVLLEPYYEFCLEVPEQMAGRAMTDLDKFCARFEAPAIGDGMAVLTGTAPVATIQNYQKEVIAYTKGHGRLACTLKGYGPCHNQEDIVKAAGYDPEADLENPTGSVFCAHGAGFYVNWDQVKEYMHMESCLAPEARAYEASVKIQASQAEEWIGTDEVDAILARTYYANQNRKSSPYKRKSINRPIAPTGPTVKSFRKPVTGEEYLLVDGYNIIFAWEELKELAEVNIDGAKDRLLDILCNYQAAKGCQVIAVFDAYRVKGHGTEYLDYHNIHVVYTREAETADQYIEKFAHENREKYQVTVATSDGLEQVIIRGQGCRLLSARELKEEIEQKSRQLREDYSISQTFGKQYLFDTLSDETAKKIEDIRLGKEDKPRQNN